MSKVKRYEQSYIVERDKCGKDSVSSCMEFAKHKLERKFQEELIDIQGDMILKVELVPFVKGE